MSTAVELWKTAHILSGAVLFGTGVGIAFMCYFGYRRAIRKQDIDGLRATLRLTVIGDATFIAPAVAFQALSGTMLMHLLGWPWVSAWSAAVFGLFVLAGVCWLPVVYIQVRLSREADRCPSVRALPSWFHRWIRVWVALGAPAFSAVLLLYYLMVAKPLSVAGT
jgi:uncharacterized membrane protein